ncbi:exodeoxyribonuclease VII small subunit [Novimethylophilus kurashikiensis]|jgi:exodeoxyribonuclease VII small subunit|uniref:Exodeoxyribonuclease 7 small subunit n=1 Tax=Novimethylophilus kurashikiensis TaxID=1825523 RepID=A0A2R5FBT2_9PROT|nr:exodeoxyribonuclease VII small subunit [Novimethylophilus kurashikiensis]GBG15680.1 exodeoxyribonuclease VII small subunit [Novimethylophilus kurashikiensis]
MTQSAPPQNFEAALADLSDIVRQMEEGQLPLEQSLEAYKRGAELLQYCQKSLQEAEQQVRILNEQNNLQNFSIDD